MATFFGTPSEDEIFAEGSGNEYLGLAGDDILEGNSGEGNNLLDGGEGRDELFANTGDILRGGVGNDVLDARGGSGGNTLLGGRDNDVLFGGTNDNLFGGFGTDFLFAGSGNNITGGNGGDQFWLVNAELPSTLITVTDFQPNVDVLGFSLSGEINSFADLTFAQQENGVLISYNEQEIALIRGVQVADLTTDNVLVAGVDPLDLDIPPETDPGLNPPAPVGTEAITLTPLTTVTVGEGDNQVAEIVAYDATTQRFFVTNSDAQQVEILDGSDPANLTLIGRLNFAAGVNSVTAKNGLIAVAVENVNPQEAGTVVFFDAAVDPTTSPQPLATVTVGAMPDMVTFTPDGTKVLVANEGEPSEDYSVDPEGSVSIIEVNRSEGGINPTVTNVSFAGFNDQREALIESGVKISAPGATVAQDLEPEYIAVSPDGSQAFITLQENNAIAILDIVSATITNIVPLGAKDYSDGLAAEAPFSSLVVFGDSLSDTGNLFELTGGTYPPSPPYFNGRFSNGPIWIDYLTTSLGLTAADVNNFAVGGAQTGEGNVENIVGRIDTDLPGLQNQIEEFTTQVGIADPDALYFFWAGANDFLILPEDPQAVQAAITNAVTNINTAVANLATTGAENIVVSNLPSLGLTPLSRVLQTSEQAQQLTQAYNQALAASLISLEQNIQAQNPEFDLVLVDLFSEFQKIETNPAAFGLSNITDPFSLEAVAVTQPNLVGLFPEPSVQADEYAFFDLVHPTTAIHEYLSKVFLESVIGTTLDPSDEDGGINLGNAPVFGLLQPDGISAFEIAGQTYYVIANEGDARDYDGFREEVRVADVILDPIAFPNAAELQLDENLGRLRITNALGDTDGDGDFDELYAYGGRSFSILNSNGEIIFDSGDDFERITATLVPELFNSNGTLDTFDERSDDKGPEPESVVTGQIGDRVFAFIGLERTGGIMVYEITNPTDAEFVQYINNTGDISPEGLEFISAANSPTGQPLLAVANEVSGTTTLYDIQANFPIAGNTAPQIQVPATPFTIPENSALGTQVGTVVVVDAEGDTITYSITSGNPDLDADGVAGFTISNEGIITVADSDDLDFETEPNINLQVTATDGELTDTETIQINLTNIDEPTPAPTVEDRTFIIPENRPNSVRVGQVTTANFEGENLTFSILQGNTDLDGDGTPAFTLNPSTGEIFIADRDDLDFENNALEKPRGAEKFVGFELAVQATDNQGASDTGNITIELIDQQSARRGQNGRNVFRFEDLDEFNLLFRFDQSEAAFLNEIGLFPVEDEEGTINGLLPEDAGYLQAALAQAEVIFSNLSDAPNNFNQSALSRIISGASLNDTFFGLYLVQDSTTDLVLNALTGGETPPNVFFATASNSAQFINMDEFNEEAFELFFEDKPNSGNSEDFNDIVVTVEKTAENRLGNQPQGEVELLDLSDLPDTETVQATFTVHREAAFENFIGFYRVDNPEGQMDELNPNSANVTPQAYLAEALERLVTTIAPGANQATATVQEELNGGSMLAPFILANGDLDALLNGNNLAQFVDGNVENGEVYFPYMGVNSDNFDHIRLLADNTFGFEDKPGGGDRDYNDLVMQVTFA